jgi:hypothetical protein
MVGKVSGLDNNRRTLGRFFALDRVAQLTALNSFRPAVSAKENSSLFFPFYMSLPRKTRSWPDSSLDGADAGLRTLGITHLRAVELERYAKNCQACQAFLAPSQPMAAL